MNLAEHFTDTELACRCGCGFCEPMNTLLDLAEAVRAVMGKPMIVHSCCRCSDHNRKVGGAPASRHLFGLAMDFHVKGMTAVNAYRRIMGAYQAGKLPGLGGLGLYDWGLHIDADVTDDGHLRLWDYRTDKE